MGESGGWPGPSGRPSQLAQALGVKNLNVLLRRCDRKIAARGRAQCLFFTLGGQQTGAGAIVGWRDVLAPAMEEIRFWPFDGPLDALLAEPGIVVSEIYPREAYTHLGLTIGPGTGRSKTRRADRQAMADRLLE